MDGFLVPGMPHHCKVMEQGNMAPPYLQVKSAVSMSESEGGGNTREEETQLRDALGAGLSLNVSFILISSNWNQLGR